MSHVGGAPPPGYVPAYRTRKRGWGRIIAGILGIVVAVPLLVGGILVLVGVSQWEGLDPDAQGRVPGEVTLDAEDGATYVVALGTGLVNETGGGRAFHTGFARDVRCTITHPDGAEESIRGDRQGHSVEGDDYASVGEFEGRGGDTTVDCGVTSTDVFGDEPDLPMIVHEVNVVLRYVGYGLIAGAVLIMTVGVGLLLWGIRGRLV